MMARDGTRGAEVGNTEHKLRLYADDTLLEVTKPLTFCNT